MSRERLTLPEACRQAVEIVCRNRDVDRLYSKAIRSIGEGELLTGIMDMAADAVQDENLREEVFASNESMLSFLCGVWMQFLLTEIAGIKTEKLRSLAQMVFDDARKDISIH